MDGCGSCKFADGCGCGSAHFADGCGCGSGSCN